MHGLSASPFPMNQMRGTEQDQPVLLPDRRSGRSDMGEAAVDKWLCDGRSLMACRGL